MTERIYPLKLAPSLSQRLWGGAGLTDFLKLAPPEGDPLGESWQVYADNEVVNGPFAGQSLQAVATRLGGQFLGEACVKRYDLKFPLLAKFIGAEDKLSIQVHPDDNDVRRHDAASDQFGKTEAWYVIQAEPEATIIWGFSETVSAEQVRQAVSSDALERYLNKLPVQAGDVIYNPAGTVHALGAGLLIFEIQQASDLTYRLYDYRRRDAKGKQRELHLDKALEVADLKARSHKEAKLEPQSLDGLKFELVRSDFFVMERYEVKNERALTTTPISFETLTVVEGAMVLHSQATPVSLRQGESLVLPAALGNYQIEGEVTLLRCYLPNLG